MYQSKISLFLSCNLRLSCISASSAAFSKDGEERLVRILSLVVCGPTRQGLFLFHKYTNQNVHWQRELQNILFLSVHICVLLLPVTSNHSPQTVRSGAGLRTDQFHRHRTISLPASVHHNTSALDGWLPVF